MKQVFANVILPEIGCPWFPSVRMPGLNCFLSLPSAWRPGLPLRFGKRREKKKWTLKKVSIEISKWANKQMGSGNYRVKVMLALFCDFGENGCEGDYSPSDLRLSLYIYISVCTVADLGEYRAYEPKMYIPPPIISIK